MKFLIILSLCFLCLFGSASADCYARGLEWGDGFEDAMTAVELACEKTSDPRYGLSGKYAVEEIRTNCYVLPDKINSNTKPPFANIRKVKPRKQAKVDLTIQSLEGGELSPQACTQVLQRQIWRCTHGGRAPVTIDDKKYIIHVDPNEGRCHTPWHEYEANPTKGNWKNEG